MFEHLSPSVETKKLTNPSQLKLYLPFLFLAFFVFIFIFSATRGPSGQASGDVVSDFNSYFVFEKLDKQLVKDSSNVSLFDFVLQNNLSGASLYRLKIELAGFYQLDLIDNLKLYHGSTQLGAVKIIDENGSLYFQLADYVLPAGQNHFSLRLIDSYRPEPGTAFNFVIADRADLALQYKDNIVFPSGDFPAKSGLISFLAQGYLSAFAGSSSDYFLAAKLPYKIATFSLANFGETADLYYLRFTYQGADLEGTAFALLEDDKLLAQTQAQNGQLEFLLSHSVNINQQKSFAIYALDLPAGNFLFSLEEAQARAYYSGKDIGLKDSLSLGDYQVRPYYLEFKDGFFNTKLTEGWNKIYEADLKAVGKDELFVYKLSWELDYQDLVIENWELWLDKQMLVADFNWQSGELIVKAAWDKPWSISSQGAKLSLLAKIKNLGSQALLKSKLAVDEEELSLESLDANIIWSEGDNFYSSYRLPYLPLSPSVLSR